jgi:hypothetical protein
MRDRARQPVQLRHHQSIALPGELEGIFEGFPLPHRTGLLLEYFLAATLLKLAKLRLQTGLLIYSTSTPSVRYRDWFLVIWRRR